MTWTIIKASTREFILYSSLMVIAILFGIFSLYIYAGNQISLKTYRDQGKTLQGVIVRQLEDRSKNFDNYYEVKLEGESHGQASVVAWHSGNIDVNEKVILLVNGKEHKIYHKKSNNIFLFFGMVWTIPISICLYILLKFRIIRISWYKSLE
ncbi:MAG: hypothetical protein OEZ39_17285 [Gammaproteobacteria bacterium]|nr:hypothetical protein [Gammaproteobacteria bacterium]MDH5653617.1 hypothetical protein [Gammaproteobacteria bacterium]